jgi:uncharacterized protein (DUF433 family)
MIDSKGITSSAAMRTGQSLPMDSVNPLRRQSDKRNLSTPESPSDNEPVVLIQQGYRERRAHMQTFRVTHNPAVMGGKPCIRGLRVTVGTILGLLAAGHSRECILKAYPYLEAEDIDAALAYAAWRLEEREEELVVT